MSTPDQGRMLADLGRTVAQAGYDTLVETWKLRRLLAGAELAEADLTARLARDRMNSAIFGADATADAAAVAETVYVDAVDVYEEALATYRAARVAR